MSLLLGWLGYSVLASHADVFRHYDTHANKTHENITVNQILKIKKASALETIKGIDHKTEVRRVQKLNRIVNLYTVGLSAGKKLYPIVAICVCILIDNGSVTIDKPKPKPI